MEKNKSFKGLDLLNMIFEFIEMTPDESQWNLRSLEYNKPRYVRLQRIQSLIVSFGLLDNKKSHDAKTNNVSNPNLRDQINSVLSGKFIGNKEINDYKDLLDFAMSFLLERGYSKEHFIANDRISTLEFIYPKMLQYKIKLRELIDFNSGWYEVSSMIPLFHIALTNSITSHLVDKHLILDSVLEMFINPFHLNFGEEELIKKYGYPTDDLEAIDLDYV